MLNLLKMDIRRMFRGKLFYILVLALGILLGTFAMTGTTGGNSIAELIGPISGGGSNMMASMGMSMTLIFAAIFVTSLIGSDFSTGFIKNILTVHSKKSDYIISKLIIGAIASVIMIAFYCMLMVILGAIKGLSGGFPGFGGVLLFLIQQVMLSVALNAIIIMVNVLVRNRVIGILACFFIGMGAISMLLSMIGSTYNIQFISILSTLSVGGCSTISTLTPSVIVFFQTFAVAIVWSVAAIFGAAYVLKNKDLKQ